MERPGRRSAQAVERIADRERGAGSAADLQFIVRPLAPLRETSGAAASSAASRARHLTAGPGKVPGACCPTLERISEPDVDLPRLIDQALRGEVTGDGIQI